MNSDVEMVPISYNKKIGVNCNNLTDLCDNSTILESYIRDSVSFLENGEDKL